MKKLVLTVSICALILGCSNSSSSSKSISNVDRSLMRSFITDIKNSWSFGVTAKDDIVINDGLDIIYRSKVDSLIEYTFTREIIDGAIQTGIYFGDDDARVDSLGTLLSAIDSSIYNNITGSVEFAIDQPRRDSLLTWNAANNRVSFVTQTPGSFEYIPVNHGTQADSINIDEVSELSAAKNFLIYTDHSAIFKTTGFGASPDSNSTVRNLKNANYDMIIIRPEVRRVTTTNNIETETIEMFNSFEMDSLKTKRTNGRNKRLVFCEINVSEAREKALYWQEEWSSERPQWMKDELRPGVYAVDYRDSEWQDALLKENLNSTNSNSYIKKIRNAGFDGIFLTGVDAFHQHEAVDTTSSTGIIILN